LFILPAFANEVHSVENAYSAIHAAEEEYAASYSVYHTYFHDMPNFTRESVEIEDDMPNGVRHNHLVSPQNTKAAFDRFFF